MIPKGEKVNKLRRITIREAIKNIVEARELLESALEGEQNAYDNMPESLQCAEQGEKMSEVIFILENEVAALG